MTDLPLDREAAMGLLLTMRKIRQFEERIIPIYPTDVMVTPVHLHIGQEAVPVGVCAHLTPKDAIFFGHDPIIYQVHIGKYSPEGIGRCPMGSALFAVQ